MPLAFPEVAGIVDGVVRVVPEVVVETVGVAVLFKPPAAVDEAVVVTGSGPGLGLGAVLSAAPELVDPTEEAAGVVVEGAAIGGVGVTFKALDFTGSLSEDDRPFNPYNTVRLVSGSPVAVYVGSSDIAGVALYVPSLVV